jgi:HK97 family phage portal protein
MSLLDSVLSLLSLGTYSPQARTAYDDWDSQLARATRRFGSVWSAPSVSEALAVPAIYRAVTMLANTVGALTLIAYREGAEMPQAEAPRLIVRPNPLTTPREFFRETTYAMATYGEAGWWIAKRDIDGNASALYPMPPNEVVVSANDSNPLRPFVEWRGRLMPNEDVRQVIFNRTPGALRGTGPLQACGAAVSAGVEAQTWAASFFAQGGVPSVIIKAADEQTEDTAKDLKAQWVETPSNVPRVIDPRIESVEDFGFDPAKAQLTESRRYSRGDAAQMFGIPATLLDHYESGSSLTYQNIQTEYDKFVRACLWPNYIEPIEQEMSDLLTRSTVARFSLEGLLRPDIKTRYEVHEKAITNGIYDAGYARTVENIDPGNVETAPVPFAPPQAVPTVLPVRTAAEVDVHCSATYANRAGLMVRCGRRLGKVPAGSSYSLYCQRCKTETEGVA